jgi:hypothetical protein
MFSLDPSVVGLVPPVSVVAWVQDKITHDLEVRLSDRAQHLSQSSSPATIWSLQQSPYVLLLSLHQTITMDIIKVPFLHKETTFLEFFLEKESYNSTVYISENYYYFQIKRLFWVF